MKRAPAACRAAWAVETSNVPASRIVSFDGPKTSGAITIICPPLSTPRDDGGEVAFGEPVVPPLLAEHEAVAVDRTVAPLREARRIGRRDLPTEVLLRRVREVVAHRRVLDGSQVEDRL